MEAPSPVYDGAVEVPSRRAVVEQLLPTYRHVIRPWPEYARVLLPQWLLAVNRVDADLFVSTCCEAGVLEDVCASAPSGLPHLRTAIALQPTSRLTPADAAAALHVLTRVPGYNNCDDILSLVAKAQPREALRIVQEHIRSLVGSVRARDVWGVRFKAEWLVLATRTAFGLMDGATALALRQTWRQAREDNPEFDGFLRQLPVQ